MSIYITNKRRRRPPFFLLLLIIFLWSMSSGWVLAKISTATTPKNTDNQLISNVDVVPPRYQTGLSIYLEKCATCHIGIPPQVLPTETWQIILQDSQHYGVQLPILQDPALQLVWNYLQIASRPKSPQEDRIPYRMASSRYFKALHPKVQLPQELNIKSCVTCHPKVEEFDFRTLSGEWEE
ncbi:MAG: diheme cytochrome C [Microcoleaceae cyanobacterium MO_207.B10]|nr:diheme cytochrome C [Microcoleaceae cyanobacterium MO_207.B10]